MLIKYDGYVTMGSADHDWIMYDAELDKVRIQRDVQQQVGAHGPPPPPAASVPSLDPNAPLIQLRWSMKRFIGSSGIS